MPLWNNTDGTLSKGKTPVIEGFGEDLEIFEPSDGEGVFVKTAPSKSFVWSRAKLGVPAAAARFAAAAVREDSPYWFKPAAGGCVSKIPPQTAFLLVERSDGLYSLIVPLPSEAEANSLVWHNGALAIYSENGDPVETVKGGVAAFVALGDSPEKLIEDSASWISRARCKAEDFKSTVTVQADEAGAAGDDDAEAGGASSAGGAGQSGELRIFPSARLRKFKKTPDFMDKFGWCTWNAFYQDVSHDNVKAGLESFKAAGVSPKFVVLDDGWQQVEDAPTGGKTLAGFGANEKFPGGLKATVEMAKGAYGVERFLVWHAVSGYWRGASPSAFPQYKPKPTQVLQGRYNTMQPVMEWQPGVISYLPNKNLRKFFLDYHAALAAEGVDGVKVDNQSSLSFLAAGSGGRARLYKNVRDALDFSAEKTFSNRFISCMAHAQEIWYNARNNNISRGSDDFFPHDDASHGFHVWTNAMTGAWFGEFMWIDWDMFESAHKFGAYHAAARAISGGPVYVADKPGATDAALVRKLVYSDGTAARADAPAKPAPDSLFRDPFAEKTAFKAYAPVNDAAVVGLFDLDTGSPESEIEATLSPATFPKLRIQRYAVYLHERHTVTIVNREDSVSVKLGARKYEVATIAPIKFALFAPIGLINMFNSAAAILSVDKAAESGVVSVKLRDGGVFGAWSKNPPTRVRVNGAKADFSWDGGLLEVPVAAKGEAVVEMKFVSAS